MGGSFKREGTYVYLWLIHVDVWQKPSQYHNYLPIKNSVVTKQLFRTSANRPCPALPPPHLQLHKSILSLTLLRIASEGW